MDSPLIQLLLKDRLLETFSFKGDTLRIGRMKENDIVISNASVSRFHAVLRREKGKVILEDSGSENGCYVNGTRIVNSIVLARGDEILIGKHRLVLGDADAEAEAEAPSEPVREERNDVWDASQTYFVAVEDQAKMLEGSAGSKRTTGTAPEAEDAPPPAAASSGEGAESPAAEVEPVVDDTLLESATVAVEDDEPEPIAEVHPEPVGDAEEDVEAWSSATADAEEEGESDETTSPPEPGGDAPFDFDLEADLASVSPEGEATVDYEDFDVEVVDEEVEEANQETADFLGSASDEPELPLEAIWYAGLIIQHQGKLDRIISWDQDQLTAGRSGECEIFLDQAEISRRHALFVREEGRYEVRDLDSINGILVNGEKTRERGLEVGDVVKIEDFEITFLLDRQPIASEIKTNELATPASAGAEDGFNMTMIDEDLPFSAATADPGPAAAPAVQVEEKLPEIPEGSLFDRSEAEGEEIAGVPLEAEDSPAPEVTEDVVTFEVRVRLEDLPAALRTALADLEQGELRLPVEMVLKAED